MSATVAARLVRAARRRAGMTQAALALAADMPRSVVNAYERGTRDPGAEQLARLLGAAGVELSTRPAPSIDVDRNARVLEQVLDLAELLPYRRRPLRYPPFPR